MSFRTWASIGTVVLLGIILFFAREEIFHAWELLGQVNLWILALIIPAQIVVYLVSGEMMFAYLRDKKLIKDISVAEQARMALEMNFVNHTLPSAGVSGISYMTWRLSKHGVSPGRATLAQLVRFVTQFAAFTVLLAVSLIVITADGDINRVMILLSGLIVSIMVGGTFAGVYLVSSPSRSKKFGTWATKQGNRILRIVMRNRRRYIKDGVIEHFLLEMHDDYLQIKREKRLLLKPFLWGLLFTAGDVLLFWITFWALGSPINPAPLLIAYGLAFLSSLVLVTPGGAGGFEAIMVSFLAVAGISGGVAIAGVLLTRVILLLGTILFGYIFYQHALVKYGKPKSAV